MSKTYDIAICDSTSLAGETLIRLLEDKSFPVGSFYPLSDDSDRGASVEFRGDDVDVTTESGFECADVDLLFVPCGSSVKEMILQQAMAAGCMVIDGSRGAAALYGSLVAFSGGDESVLESASMQKRVVIPSSPAAVLLTALQAINDIAPVERIDLTALQSASGAGNAGIDELRKQTVDLLNGKPVEGNVFSGRLAYNLIPQVGAIDDCGMTAEEVMIEAEICSGLNVSGIDVRSTCVVAPVFYGDCLSVTLDTENSVGLDAIAGALTNTGSIEVFQGDEFPTVEQAAGSNEIMVGRLRNMPGRDSAVGFWLAADASRQGALSAVLVAEALIRDFL